MQEIKLFQIANSLIDVLVYVPSLGKAYDTADWGPRHAVVSLEHLLDLVAGGESERLDKLHGRMSQMDFTPGPRLALLNDQRDDTPEFSQVAHPADDEKVTADPSDEASNPQLKSQGYEQTISDDVSAIAGQEMKSLLDLQFMARSIETQQEQKERSDDGGDSPKYMVTAGSASQPLLPLQPDSVIHRPGGNYQINLDYQQILSSL